MYDKILDCEKRGKNLDGSDVGDSIDYNGIEMSSSYIKKYTMKHLNILGKFFTDKYNYNNNSDKNFEYGWCSDELVQIYNLIFKYFVNLDIGSYDSVNISKLTQILNDWESNMSDEELIKKYGLDLNVGNYIDETEGVEKLKEKLGLDLTDEDIKYLESF